MRIQGGIVRGGVGSRSEMLERIRVGLGCAGNVSG